MNREQVKNRRRALGWDVNHETQKNPFEQEVKVERKEHGFRPVLYWNSERFYANEKKSFQN